MTVKYKNGKLQPDYGDLPEYLKPVYKALLTDQYRRNPVSDDQFRKIVDKALLQVPRELMFN